MQFKKNSNFVKKLNSLLGFELRMAIFQSLTLVFTIW